MQSTARSGVNRRPRSNAIRGDTRVAQHGEKLRITWERLAADLAVQSEGYFSSDLPEIMRLYAILTPGLEAGKIDAVWWHSGLIRISFLPTPEVDVPERLLRCRMHGGTGPRHTRRRRYWRVLMANQVVVWGPALRRPRPRKLPKRPKPPKAK